MNIVIDLRPLIGAKVSGVTIYMNNLIRELIRIDKENNYYFYYNSFRTIEIDKEHFKNWKIIRTKIPNILFNVLLSIFRWPKLDKIVEKRIGKKIDAFFFMDPRPAPISKNVKKIMTFHDLSFERYPHNFSFRTKIWHKLLRPKKEARTSDHIIAVSEFTKQELIDYYKIPEEKITVVYHGISRHFQDIYGTKRANDVLEKYSVKNPFVLSVSTLEPRKNIQNLIKALDLLNKKDPENTISLVVVGKKNLKIFKEPYLEDKPFVKLLGFVPFEDKIALFSSADCYASSSFYEGFCFPVLEAMKCGSPVVSSTAGAIPEITKEYAILCDPFDIEGFSSSIEKAIMRGRNEDITLQAKDYARTFTWRKCAEKTLKVFSIDLNPVNQ